MWRAGGREGILLATGGIAPPELHIHSATHRMTAPIPANDPTVVPARPFRERRTRRRRLHPALRSAIWLGVLAVVFVVTLFAYHTYRTAPRDARAITEREFQLSVLRPGERVVQTVSVFRRSPLDYYRATRGIVVLTDKRLLYLGLVPRDLVASPDAPSAFEQREFPIDTLHKISAGRTFLYLAHALVIHSPDGSVRLGVPADAWSQAEALTSMMEQRYEAVRAEGRRQTQLRAQTEQARKQAEVEARQARYHVVARGEALGSIARKYNVTPDYLQKLNNLPDARIRVGQRLMVKPQT